MNAEDVTEIVRKQTDYFGSSELSDRFDITNRDFENSEDDFFDSWDSLNYSLNASVTSVQLESVIRSLETEYYLIPEFQRQFVWKKNQIASLAFSLIKGFPIPPIYLFVDEETKKQVILDGHQRTTALFLYVYGLYFVSEAKRKKINFQNVYTIMSKISELNEKLVDTKDKETTKAISELYNQLKEKYGLVKTTYSIKDNMGNAHDISFNSFKEEEQEFLKRKPIHTSIVECRGGIEPQRFYAMVFKELNSGGKTLGTQEIRNGVYWKTDLYRGLHRLNEENENWRKIYGNVSLYSKDVEQLLKTLSLNYYTEYNGYGICTRFEGTFNWVNIMEAYSSKALKENDLITQEELSRLEKYLQSFSFDDEINKCSKAVFEAVFVCMCKAGFLEREKEKKEIKLSWLVELSKSDIFAEVLSNKSSVEKRLSKTYEKVMEKYGS